MDWTPVYYAVLTVAILGVILRARAVAIRKDNR